MIINVGDTIKNKPSLITGEIINIGIITEANDIH